MNKAVLALIGVAVLGAVAISGIIAKPPSSKNTSIGTPRPSTYILRKDVTFTVDGLEYTTGDPNEKFLLAGADKDLIPKKRTMSKVGSVTIDGQEREVWRCHVYDRFKGKELVYLYVLKDPDKFIMDVYLSEKYWDTQPHDEEIVIGSELKPIDQVSVDIRVNLNGIEKLYTSIKNSDGTSQKEKFSADSIHSLHITPILKSSNVKNIGNLDIYQLEGDITNITLYGVETGSNILDGNDHEFYVFGVITGPGSGKPVSYNSLQLKTIPFVLISRGNWWLPDCKPAVYLYPDKKEKINVKVYPKGELTLTIPQYEKDGWDVIADPSGKIDFQSQNFDYLYYEAKIRDEEINMPKEGYSVKFEDLASFYSEILPKLGLNSKEIKDFKEYWEKYLPYSPYYFVGLMDKNSIDKIEPLSINPVPKTILRVRFYFKSLDKPIDTKMPVLTSSRREGFTVVEWGGMVKMDKGHPFTCSQ